MGTKIIELPVTSAVLGDGYIPISQDATGSNRVTYKVTAQQIANYIGATTSSGTVNNVAVECADGSLAVTGSPITTKGVINVSVNSITLDKINSGGATNGQVLTYDGVANRWKPIDSSNTGVTADSVQIGTVLWFAASSAPLGYLECDGSSKRIIDFPELAVLLGTTYGALLNGGTEFILPDLRGEFVRGWSHGKTGVNTGRVFGSNEEGSVMVTHVGQTGGGAMAIGGYNFDSTQAYTNTNVQIAGTLTNYSGNRLVGSRPRNIALLPCIKAIKTVQTTSTLLNFIEKPASPLSGQVLTYNGSAWIAKNPISSSISTANYGTVLCDITTANIWYSFTNLMNTTWVNLFGVIPKKIDLYVQTGQSALDYTIGNSLNTISILSGARGLENINGNYYCWVNNAFDSGNNNNKVSYATFKLDDNGNFFVRRGVSGGGGSIKFIIAGHTVL